MNRPLLVEILLEDSVKYGIIKCTISFTNRANGKAKTIKITANRLIGLAAVTFPTI
jgi:hypothetical protein